MLAGNLRHTNPTATVMMELRLTRAPMLAISPILFFVRAP